MNEEDFLRLLNLVTRVAKPMCPTYDLAKSLDDNFADIDIDSLDALLLIIYMCDLFDVPEEIGKGFAPITVRNLYDLLMEHKTKVPESIEEAVKGIQ